MIKTKSNIIAALKSENEKLESENTQLKKQLNELKGELKKRDSSLYILRWQMGVLLVLAVIFIVYFIFK